MIGSLLVAAEDAMFVVTVTRGGKTRKTMFVERDHAQRYADNVRRMPGKRQPDAVELLKASEDERTLYQPATSK